jgi:hypothetical protein
VSPIATAMNTAPGKAIPTISVSYARPGPYAAPTLSAVLTDGTAPLAGVTALTRMVVLAV